MLPSLLPRPLTTYQTHKWSFGLFLQSTLMHNSITTSNYTNEVLLTCDTDPDACWSGQRLSILYTLWQFLSATSLNHAEKSLNKMKQQITHVCNKYNKSSNTHLTVWHMHTEFSKMHTKLGIHINRLSWQSLIILCSCFDFVQNVAIKCSGVLEETTAGRLNWCKWLLEWKGTKEMSWSIGSTWPVTTMEVWRMENIRPKPMNIQNVQELHFSGKHRSDRSHCPNYYWWSFYSPIRWKMHKVGQRVTFPHLVCKCLVITQDILNHSSTSLDGNILIFLNKIHNPRSCTAWLH